MRVIARVPVALRAEAALSAGARLRQRSMLASAQASIAREAARSDGFAVVESFPALPFMVLEASGEGLEQLRQSRLRYVEDTLSVPFLDNTVALVGARQAADGGLTGAGQTIVVIDTGVASDHPMLAGKTVAEACFSSTSEANGGSSSLCPDGGGAETGDGAGGACSDQVAGCDHGTHVAAIALGEGPELVGVAPGADLVAVQVFSRFDSQTTCGLRAAPCALSYTSDQIRALQHVAELAERFDIAAVNMSLGGGKTAFACDDDPRVDAIEALRALEIPVVVASGNNGFDDGIGFPACISAVISVGATTDADAVAGFSNTAPILDMFAPGEAILSAVPGGGVASKNGTSMAAPHVAGAFALAFEADPDATVADLTQAFRDNAVTVTGRGVTRPRLDVSFLAAPRVPDPDPDPDPTPARPQPPGPVVTPGRGVAPVAFATLWYNGDVQSGTANVSARFDPDGLRYEITLAGEDYHYTRYATLVTPAGDQRRCRASSAAGKLIVECRDGDGRPALSRFAFATFELVDAQQGGEAP